VYAYFFTIIFLSSYSVPFHQEIFYSPFNIGITDTSGHIGFFYFVNVYFCFRHASITDGAFVAESGRSIHRSSASVLGKATQYRTEGRNPLAEKTLLNYDIHFKIVSNICDIREHG